MTYQDFLMKIKDGVQIVGVRASESIQRAQNLSKTTTGKKGSSAAAYVYPIYDWKTNDIFKFLRDRKEPLPEIYKYLWESGIGVNGLRVSQFFSIDSAKSLVNMMEYYPELYDKILNREPNASLAMYYWDSEMFRRSTKKRKRLEKKTDAVDWKTKYLNELKNPVVQKKSEYRSTLVIVRKFSMIMTDNHYMQLYNILVSGDPKNRAVRAVYSNIFSVYSKKADKEIRNARFTNANKKRSDSGQDAPSGE
jgi:predicted phosphoadenosine phosphosulfate sulfurtransferase